MMKRKLTRSERRLQKHAVIFWVVVAVWAAMIACILTAKAETQEKAQEKIAPSVVVLSHDDAEAVHLAGEDTLASGYSNIELLDNLGVYKVTAYCACPKCCGIWSSLHPIRIGTDYVQRTASGTIPTPGKTIAADWSVLPNGTEIILEGLSYTVEDTGSGVNGKHIDVFMDNHNDACVWGVKYIEIYKEAE